MWYAYFQILKKGATILACHAHFIQSKNRQWNFASEWLKISFLWVDKRNREFFPEKLSQRLEMCFFKNVNHNIHRWRHIVFRKKVIWTLWDKFSWKNVLFHLSTHKKRKFEPLRSKIHLSVFALYEMGVAGHTLFQNSKISVTSFLDSFPGSVTHFTSFEGGGY